MGLCVDGIRRRLLAIFFRWMLPGVCAAGVAQCEQSFQRVKASVALALDSRSANRHDTKDIVSALREILCRL
jgi:hypothetical protein